jgi:predicted metal-binding membrane protein
MNTSVAASQRSRAPGATQYRGTLRTGAVAALSAIALVAWVITVIWANDMGNMPGTMGMGVVEFVAMWTLMMSAMMLPSVAPMSYLYSKTITAKRTRRLSQFVSGYIAAWAATGLVAFLLAWIAGRLATDNPTAAQAMAALVFASVGIYQLTPLKSRCLNHCRTPLGHMMHYASFQGPLRHFNAGAHHGIFCLGCCWALMVLMVAFGVMNIWAMVGLAIVIALEKLWRHGELLSKTVGVASLILAIVVIFRPELAPGLTLDDMMNMGSTAMS